MSKFEEYGVSSYDDLILMAKVEPESFIETIGLKPFQAKRIENLLLGTGEDILTPKHCSGDSSSKVTSNLSVS